LRLLITRSFPSQINHAPARASATRRLRHRHRRHRRCHSRSIVINNNRRRRRRRREFGPFTVEKTKVTTAYKTRSEIIQTSRDHAGNRTRPACIYYVYIAAAFREGSWQYVVYIDKKITMIYLLWNGICRRWDANKMRNLKIRLRRREIIRTIPRTVAVITAINRWQSIILLLICITHSIIRVYRMK